MNGFRIKIALRLMARQKFFTTLNLLGLSVGAACFLLIYIYVTDELSFDKFHQDSDRLYRVNMTNIWIQSNEVFGSTSPAVMEAIENDIPEVEVILRLHPPYYFSEQIVSLRQIDGEKRTYQESDILASDDGFFDLFTFPMIEGDPATALTNPNSIVITKSHAEKYFKGVSAIGKSISIGIGENEKTFGVTGVIDDLPDQSHFHFDLLVSMNSFPYIKRRSNSWIWTTFVTYLRLDPNADLKKVNESLAKLPAKYVGQERAEEKNWKLALHNIEDIRLYSDRIYNRLGPIGNIDNVLIFSSIAVLILLLSCINFMNLSTAKFTVRAKEIGLQKVMGSSRANIRWQFLIESTLFSFISIILGLGLAELARPFFNQLAGKEISLNLFTHPELLLVILILTLIIGIISGTYPAWFMTRFKVIDAIKGKISNTGSRNTFRNALVVFQFTISIALISASFLVKDQLEFLKAKDVGFQKEQVIIIPHLEWMADKGEVFGKELIKNGIFDEVAISNAVPPNVWNQENLTPLGSPKTTDLAVTCLTADAHFIPILDLPLKAGRNFFAEGEGDLNKVIVNEECAIQMEWIKPGEDPSAVLGKQLSYYGDEMFEVVGVMEDFNFWALNNPIEPLAIFHPEASTFQGGNTFLTARVNETNQESYEQLIDQVSGVWLSIYPNLPFTYQFMDDIFDQAFTSQRRFGNILDVFSVLAIIIAILGLTGLIAYTTEQKTKEFGIRKVLGASVTSLIQLISLDFLKLLVVAVLLGSFFSWYFGIEWLRNFTYQSPISVNIFIISAALIMTLVLVITSFIVGRNAKKNPATVLRDD